MKKKYFNLLLKNLLIGALFMFQIGCEVDDKDLNLASYPNAPDVFIDGFTPDLNYAAFGGSDPKAFDVDKEVKFAGEASMRFAVPDHGAPEGAYAGGVFFSAQGRDLSGYDCLTFWAKASQPASIAVIGFGNDLGANKYETSIRGLKMNTNWKKYYIPIPDASKLKKEKGMLYYSTGPIDDRDGYTFWIDEVKFEKLGTIAHAKASIMNGEDVQITTFTGKIHTIADINGSFSLPNGTTQVVNMTKNYFSFVSSDLAVAVVNEEGIVSTVGPGSAVITAKLGGVEAAGSLVVTATGDFVGAPVPTREAKNVISIFSNAYTNVPIEFHNGYWEPWQTTTSDDFKVKGDSIWAYNNFNFVGIQFGKPTIDASQMTNMHLDIFVPAGTKAQSLIIVLKDFGANGTDGGDDDVTIEKTLSAADLVAGKWNSIDMSLVGKVKSKLGQIILKDAPGLSSFFVDNIYLYKEEVQNSGTPTQAAPTPTHEASKVISLFSNAYTNVEVNTFRTDWSAAVLEDVPIAGNAVKKYSNLNFVGIETVSKTINASNMTHFHIDVWSPDFTKFSIKLVDFGADGAFAGGDDVEHQINFDSPAQSGWISYDIPLSDFTGLVTRGHMAQYILVAQPEGASTVFVDNIYFHGGDNGGNTGGGDTGGNTDAAPTTAAPIPPARNAADVKSIFSSAYTNITADTYLTGWSAAKYQKVTVASKQVLKYYDLDYAAIETQSQRVGISGMTHIHVDVWSPNFTNFKIKLSDAGPIGSAELSFGSVENNLPLKSQWVSYDIPLTDFVGLNQSGYVTLSIFSGTPVGGTTIYVDNFYFYKK